MNLQNYYYYFQSVLTPRICDDIIAYAKQHKPEMAVTGGIDRGEKSRKKDGTFKKSGLTLWIWMVGVVIYFGQCWSVELAYMRIKKGGDPFVDVAQD